MGLVLMVIINNAVTYIDWVDLKTLLDLYIGDVIILLQCLVSQIQQGLRD